MKFNNRLEATRWMYNNVGNSVVNFGNLKVPDRVWVAGNGMLVGDVTAWERDDLTNIRTADHREPWVSPPIDYDYVFTGDYAPEDTLGVYQASKYRLVSEIQLMRLGQEIKRLIEWGKK